MKCSHLVVNGHPVIVCGSRRIPACVKCGGPASQECDWKVGLDKTCDRPVCTACSVSPFEGKDLCPKHAMEWSWHPRNPESPTYADPA